MSRHLATSSMENPQTILEFWFGKAQQDRLVAEQQASLWWAKNSGVDRDIATRFAPALQLAANGTLNDWSETPAGRLALIVLTDQFPRNMYRGTPASFATDPLALVWSRAGVATGVAQHLRPIERVFLYMPLEHSEALDDQETSVALFQALVAQAPAEDKAVFEGYLKFAVRHRDIIARFGRFPHRNRILGRQSTVEEAAFLQEKGSSF